MNEKLLAWLTSTLEKATSALEKGADFLGGQLPLVVQEFLSFYTMWHWLLTGILFLAFLSWLGVQIWGTWLARPHSKTHPERKYWDDDQVFCIWSLCSIPSVLFLVFFFINLYKALLITFAPRVYLLKEFMEFFK